MTPINEETVPIPLLQEELNVVASQVVTDRVRVTTHVQEREVLVEHVEEQGELIVERRAVDREVKVAPGPMQEGDTLIVSLVEERLVLEKRLFVIEEVRITRVSTSRTVAKPMILRTMQASVQQQEPGQTQGRDENG
jgi:uncharacterized protein (TIGR02271 family)